MALSSAVQAFPSAKAETAASIMGLGTINSAPISGNFHGFEAGLEAIGDLMQHV